MAGNEWINGYLEAILDSRSGAIAAEEEQKPVNKVAGVHFNPTRYFVDEVVSEVDEMDLHQAWVKASATRNSLERSTRLENMCWRIWHLARKKKQVLDPYPNPKQAHITIQRATKRKWEREQGRKDAADDMSEDLSDGEKEKVELMAETVQSETSVKRFQRNISNLLVWNDDNKDKKLYIVLIRYLFSSYFFAPFYPSDFLSWCGLELWRTNRDVNIRHGFSIPSDGRTGFKLFVMSHDNPTSKRLINSSLCEILLPLYSSNFAWQSIQIASHRRLSLCKAFDIGYSMKQKC